MFEAESWTRREVEASLIAAFEAMPSLPVFAAAPRFRAAHVEDDPGAREAAAPLVWAAFLEHDEAGRKYLWAWARCRATRTSFSELCRAMGWPSATAEAGRRRAAASIAARLRGGGA